LIPKGTFDSFRAKGLPAFHEAIVRIAPFFHHRVDELRDWNQIGFLSVAVNRLTRWYRPGLLCIGDAAHAMSPIGGVGINLAVQDAVATANILASALREGPVSLGLLARVQRRRAFPTRATQALQVFLQNRVVGPTLAGKTAILSVPFPLTLLQRFPALRRIPARVIGMGFRPEHVRTAAA
jgi:2-polyprenyl-6-methoxyphenol hydroxylase-like FAD-dependent oxidoreductase